MTRPSAAGAKFAENIPRDVILLRASLAGGLDAVRAAAMHLPEFAGGPDVVSAYARWMSSPRRRSYRQRVAAALEVSKRT